MTMSEIDLQDHCAKLVQNEVNCCLSSLVSALAGAVYQHGSDDIRNLLDQAQELCWSVPDYEEAAIQAGWTVDGDMFVNHGLETTGSDADPDDACGWEDLCREFDIDPYDREVYEHWAVSRWLAEKLEAQGERIDHDFAGLHVWARTTTGQAISMDGVIRQIVLNVHNAAEG